MTITWFGWLYLAVVAFSAAASISQIGKPRQPLAPSTVIGTLIVSGLIVWGQIAVGMVTR